MAKKEIKYGGAIRIADGEPVNIKDVDKASYQPHSYRCPKCGQEMVPAAIGEGYVQVRHFRHLGKACSYNHHLHSYTEELFIREYQRCLDSGEPFYLEMSVPVACNKACVLKEHYDCNERFIRKSYNLTRQFRSIRREVRVYKDAGGKEYRIPDLLLERENGDPLWIEICVTNPVDEDKQRDGGKIVEFKVTTTDYADKLIKGHRLSQNNSQDSWVRLHNFNETPVNEKPTRALPCEKHFLYEVGEWDSPLFAQVRMVEEVPKLNDRTRYRAVLRLNWNKDHTVFSEEPVPERISKDELTGWCLNRAFLGKSNNLIITGYLVEEEYFKEVKTPARPAPLPPKKQFQKPKPQVPAETIISPSEEPGESIAWIDLGLPSGTLWADKNGKPASAIPPGYSLSLPTLGDIQEMMDGCTIEHDEDSDFLEVTGRNGLSIQLGEGAHLLAPRGREYPDFLNIYSSPSGYLHIVKEDYFKKHRKRYVLHKRAH